MSEQNPPSPVTEPLDRLQRQLDAMAGRLTRIEQKLGMAASEPPSPVPVTANAVVPEFILPPPAEDPLRPSGPADVPSADQRQLSQRFAEVSPVSSAGAGTGREERSHRSGTERPASGESETSRWETLIGGQWALWVGSVAVFFAVAFFLAYAWHYLGNAGRFSVGLIAGMTFLGAGGWARDRRERWFGEGLTGAGLAILYLSIWAGAQRYGLFAFEPAFALMAGVTAVGVSLAVRYDAVGLSALATLGGFLTPALLRSHGGGSSQAFSLLTYIALLNSGLLAVSLFKRWQGIIWLSFVATLLLMLGWAADSYTESQRWVVFAYVSLYFLLFLGAACFHSLIHHEETKQEDLLLIITSSFIYALAGYGLLEGALGNYPGVFPFALFLFFTLLCLSIHALAPENASLRHSAGGLAILFLTVTVPTQLKQGWIAIGWSVEAAVLLTLGLRLRSRLLQRSGQAVWIISLLAVWQAVLQEEPAPHLLFLNQRALPLLASVFSSAWMAAIAREREPTLEAELPSGLEERKDDLAPSYAVYAAIAGAWLIAQETYLGVGWHQYPSRATWPIGALCLIACFWAIYSLALFALGLRLRQPNVRFTAFTIATLAAVLLMGSGLMQAVPDWIPFWNLRSLAYGVVGLALGALARMVSRGRERLEPSEAEVLANVPILISLLALCALSLESYAGFRRWAVPSVASWNTAALFTLATLWLVLALILLRIGLAGEQLRLRQLAYLIGGAGAALLLVNSLESSGLDWPPVANFRFGAFMVVAVVMTSVPALIRRHPAGLSPMEGELATNASLIPLAIVLTLWGLTQETYETCHYFRYSLGADWDRAAQMAISLVWTICGVLLLVGGVLRRYQPVRLIALGLLGLTVLKVFLFDLGFLDTPYRIFCFGGLGLALIGISWLYSRFGKLTV